MRKWLTKKYKNNRLMWVEKVTKYRALLIFFFPRTGLSATECASSSSEFEHNGDTMGRTGDAERTSYGKGITNSKCSFWPN